MKLDASQVDALKELSNIGAGHAAIALSQMLKRKVMITVPRTDIIPSDAFVKMVTEKMGGNVVSIYMEAIGDVKGAIFYVFDKRSAVMLSDMLLFREKGRTKFIDEKCQSALKELGSILSGSFLTVLSDMMNLQVFHKSPQYAFDEVYDILDGVLSEIFGGVQPRMCLLTEFIESSNSISGICAYVPSNEAMQTILEKMKMLRGEK